MQARPRGSLISEKLTTIRILIFPGLVIIESVPSSPSTQGSLSKLYSVGYQTFSCMHPPSWLLQKASSCASKQEWLAESAQMENSLWENKLPLQMRCLGQSKDWPWPIQSRISCALLQRTKVKTHGSLIQEVLFTNKSFLSSQIELFFRVGTDGAFWGDDGRSGGSGGGLGGGRQPWGLNFIIWNDVTAL